MHLHLIQQAKVLSAIDVVGAPRQVNLKRAVSSAYYALFHFLVDRATALCIGEAARDHSLRVVVGRAFSHNEMFRVCQYFRDPTRFPTRFQAGLQGTPIPIALSRIATAFCELQESRHAADYNRLQRFTRPEAKRLIEQSVDAVAEWDQVAGSVPARLFLALLLVGGRGRD